MVEHLSCLQEMQIQVPQTTFEFFLSKRDFNQMFIGLFLKSVEAQHLDRMLGLCF